jgi:putative oxidoreductase
MNTKVATIEQGHEASKILNVALWVAQLGAAAMFFMAGFSKVSGNPQMVGLFQAIGVGQWFRYLTGSLELVGAVLLLIPRLSGFGGALMTGVMVAAVATHVFIIGGDPTMAIVLVLASLFVTWGRRAQILSRFTK